MEIKIDKVLMQVFDLIETADPNMCILVTERLLDLPGPRILYANKQWEEVTGYTLEEVIGKTPRILQGELSDRTTLKRLRDTLAYGGKFIGTTTNYRKDGLSFKMAWVVVAPVNNEYYVALQKVVPDNNDLQQLKSIQDIQASILKKLNEVLPLNFNEHTS